MSGHGQMGAATQLDTFRRRVRPVPGGRWSVDVVTFSVALVVASARRAPDAAFEAAVEDAERLLDLGDELGEDARTAAEWADPRNLTGRRRPEEPDVRRAVERVASALGVPLAELYETPPPSPGDVACPFCGAAPYEPCTALSGAAAGQAVAFHSRREQALAGAAEDTRPRCGRPRKDGKPCGLVVYGGRACSTHRGPLPSADGEA